MCYIFALCLIKTKTKHATKIQIKIIRQTKLKQILVIMTKTVVKTKYQIEKENRERAIYDDFNELMKQPGAMATAVTDHLMKKYNLHARSSIWQARQRTQKRINEQLKTKCNGNN
jgi:Holliday junction resolvasome RuvABC endonuclease subunit